jgi:TolB-like protein
MAHTESPRSKEFFFAVNSCKETMMKRNVFFVLIIMCCGAAVFGQNSLVLAPLQNDGGVEDGQIRTLTRLLENALQRTQRFDIIDRGAVEDILKEHGFQLSDLSDARKTAELGRILNANYLVRPSVMPLAGDLFLESRIVDVNTARMLNSAEVRIKYDLSDAYEKLGAFATTLAGAAGGAARPEQGVPAANAGEYKIGDRGPAGGRVFYDKGVFSNGWRYLEAAPAETEFGKVSWGPWSHIEGTATALGTGKRNTEIIVEFLRRKRETNHAAQLCDSLVFDGYDDWFLPSRDELNLMYTNLKAKGLGEFSDGWYWSSSESTPLRAWDQNFGNGDQDSEHGKFTTGPARAIRAF